MPLSPGGAVKKSVSGSRPTRRPDNKMGTAVKKHKDGRHEHACHLFAYPVARPAWPRRKDRRKIKTARSVEQAVWRARRDSNP